jgi:hypothetical protein
MINEKECVTNRFISVPADHGACLLLFVMISKAFPLILQGH